MKKFFNITVFVNIFWLLASIFMLMSAAIANGYPILFSDSMTYVYSCIFEEVPLDRPYFYSLLINIVAMSYSLWFVIILQALIVVFFIFVILKYLFESDRIWLKTFIISTVLSLVTGITYFVGQIVPDIFAPLLFLGTALIIVEKNLPKHILVILSIIIIYCSIVHFANIIINLSILLSLTVVSIIFRKKEFILQQKRRLSLLAFIVISSWLIIPTVNYFKKEGFVTSKVSNVFFAGSLIESGILQEYLADECENQNWNLCEYKDELDISAFQFLWDATSPLYKGGCLEVEWEKCWKCKNKELGKIKSDLLSKPKYQKMFILKSIEKTFLQFFKFKIDSRSTVRMGDLIKEYYPADYNLFITSQQAEFPLFFHQQTVFQYISFFVSLILLVIILFISPYRLNIPLKYKAFFIILFGTLIINAMVTAVFSNVVSRYQGRLVWIIPMLLLMILLNYKKFGLSV